MKETYTKAHHSRSAENERWSSQSQGRITTGNNGKITADFPSEQGSPDNDRAAPLACWKKKRNIM